MAGGGGAAPTSAQGSCFGDSGIDCFSSAGWVRALPVQTGIVNRGRLGSWAPGAATPAAAVASEVVREMNAVVAVAAAAAAAAAAEAVVVASPSGPTETTVW
jgi:hypothetical protein